MNSAPGLSTFILDKTSNGESRVTFEGELSGTVHVITHSKDGYEKSIWLPGWVLVDFVAQAVAAEKINRLRDHPHKALGIDEKWPEGRWGNKGVVPNSKRDIKRRNHG